LRTAFKERFGTPGNETPCTALVTGLKVAPDAVVTGQPVRELEVETKLDPETNGESGGVPCGAIYGSLASSWKKTRDSLSPWSPPTARSSAAAG
jgi:hypothetical protein